MKMMLTIKIPRNEDAHTLPVYDTESHGISCEHCHEDMVMYSVDVVKCKGWDVTTDTDGRKTRLRFRLVCLHCGWSQAYRLAFLSPSSFEKQNMNRQMNIAQQQDKKK